MSGPILVPLDGSAVAEHALPAVASIAARSGSDIHLIELRGADASPLVEPLAAMLGAGRVHPIALPGAITAELGEYARDANARLLVLPIESQRENARSELAASADAITRRAAVPVLLVRTTDEAKTPHEEWQCRHILVPLDGSGMSQQIVPAAATLARELDAQVTLLRVLSEFPLPAETPAVPLQEPLSPMARKRAALRELEVVARLLRNKGLSVNTRVFQTSMAPADAIIGQATEENADLIALASRGFGMAKQFPSDSVTRALVQRAQQPLLVLRPRERTRSAQTRLDRMAVFQTL